MMSAKEAAAMTRAAIKADKEKKTRAEQEKAANDRIAVKKYLDILEVCIRDEAMKGNACVEYYVPYDNYFDEDVGKGIAKAMPDFDVKIVGGVDRGYVINISWGN